MSEVTQNPPLASYYLAGATKVAGWSERALHLAFLLPTIALVLGAYRLAKRFTGSAGVAAVTTLAAPAFLVSACSVMCDPMMLALWLWGAIFWIEGLDLQKPSYLAISVLLIAASAWPVLNHEWLAEPLRRPLPHQARRYVGHAGWRKADNDAHRLRRIALRPSDSRHGR